MSYESEVLVDSPLFFTLLDRFVNTSSVPDISGNNRSGAAYQFGLIPYAAWMDAGAAFSIAAWIRTTQTGVNQICCREGGSGRTFQFRTNNANLEFIKISGGSVTSAAATSINDGSYHLAGATYDGANIRLYKDSATPLVTTAAPGSLTGTNGLSIGWRPNTTIATSTDLFFGDIVGLALFGTVLAGTRFAAYAAAGVPTGIASDGGWDGTSAVGVVG